jgi:carbon monoxide dehydrogenase subunit G
MKLTFDIQADLGFVFDHLTDMQKFVSVHPLIYKIEPVTGNCYRIHETFKLGFIPFSFTYPAWIDKNETDKTVTMRATVFKLTRITMVFDLKTIQGKTRVNEQVDFNSLLPVRPVMERIFRKQHALLFKNIEMKSKK